MQKNQLNFQENFTKVSNIMYFNYTHLDFSTEVNMFALSRKDEAERSPPFSKTPQKKHIFFNNLFI